MSHENPLVAQRHLREQQACDLDALLTPDYATRMVRAFVAALALVPHDGAILAIEGHVGRPTIDPGIRWRCGITPWSTRSARRASLIDFEGVIRPIAGWTAGWA